MKKKNNLSTVILVIAFVIGLSLLLYPPLADYWNSFHQSRAIASYMDTVSHLDQQKYHALIEEARDYNATLVGNKNRFAPTEEEEAAFFSLLDTDGGAIGYIEIPAINVSLPTYLGTSEGVLQKGIGVMEGASVPVGGESTHAVLTGHRGLPSATLFTHLDKLVKGDLFTVHTLNETLTYEIEQINVVLPQEMDLLEIEEGKDYCTLVTCTPYGINTHRMLVRGHRVENPEDLLYLQVSADAMQIEPLIIAPLMAVPILLLLMIALLSGGNKKKTTVHGKPTEKKKGGNLGD